MSQFPFLFQDKPLCCSLCDRQRKDNPATLATNQLIQTKLWKDGSSVYGLDSVVFLVSKIYKCLNGHNEVPATDPDILGKIPDCYLTFILKHRSGMTKDCARWIEEKIDAGISACTVESLIHERYQRNIYVKDKKDFGPTVAMHKKGV